MNTQGSRNYYGEYSLEQWIKLILTKEITLPDYQRAFVWTEEDVRDFINCLKNGLFVPSITIGNYRGTTNYILDGQQRLSAIIIAYLGLFPKKEEFKFTSQKNIASANENDDIEDDNEDMPLEWQFKYFVREGNDKQSILQKIDRNKYQTIDFELDDEFWKISYIGFSLIIPISDRPEEQQMLYSSVFRNINIKGKPLSNIESRQSLYFLRENFDNWFSPQFVYSITINNAPIDFVRYLSLVSQYKKNEDTGKLAQTYKTKMERYYESYILAEVNNEDESMFTRLLNSDNQTTYQKLERLLQAECFPKTFPSIIAADIYLFGLIYYTIAECKPVSITESLLEELNAEIKKIKDDTGHTKSPSAFKHLRGRVKASIEIYSKHLQTNSSNEA